MVGSYMIADQKHRLIGMGESQAGAKIIYQSLKHRGALGKEVTLQGYLIKRWNKAAKSLDIDNNMILGKVHELWIPSVISNL